MLQLANVVIHVTQQLFIRRVKSRASAGQLSVVAVVLELNAIVIHAQAVQIQSKITFLNIPASDAPVSSCTFPFFSSLLLTFWIETSKSLTAAALPSASLGDSLFCIFGKHVYVLPDSVSVGSTIRSHASF